LPFSTNEQRNVLGSTTRRVLGKRDKTDEKGRWVRTMLRV